jgi:DNA replication protein DnaC
MRYWIIVSLPSHPSIERPEDELIAIDEVGYVPMADLGAEFLFQVIAERAERSAVILTTNLPFSEWTQVIPNARLCKG